MLPLLTQPFQNKPMPHGTLKNINGIVPAACRISLPKFPSKSHLCREERDTKVQLSRKKETLLFGLLCAYQGDHHLKWEKATKGRL